MSGHTHHVAHIISEALALGAAAIEPTRQAEEEWVRHVRETTVDAQVFLRECTPSYFNGESSEKPRLYAGEPYGPGWDAFTALLQTWRERGDLAGLVVTKAGQPADETVSVI
jgi:cyclohexanone monooxygenase